jgi:predicted DNA-binding transcriptional regulator AlpA
MTHRAARPSVAHTDRLPEATPPEAGPAVERLALRLDEVAAALGVSRRAVERVRAAGRFPRPDRTLGRMPLWRVETVRAWLEGGGA